MDLTHLNAAGEAHMVDVGAKDETRRAADAEAHVHMPLAAFAALRAGNLKKGDALGAARIAGIMAAKRTSELIPLCHPIALTKIEITCELIEHESHGEVLVCSHVECHGRTGVEMEALTAVSVAALTIYDMCKALDKGIVIEQIQLLAKSGGKSGNWHR
ncbi:MAG: cyclic pyranopterin monophosphate synthase MoaC [Chloroflexi bacterium]|nr:cyclic pyranopterin monophosphate synthase MoaC [Chloroflexota bacterium]